MKDKCVCIWTNKITRKSIEHFKIVFLKNPYEGVRIKNKTQKKFSQLVNVGSDLEGFRCL